MTSGAHGCGGRRLALGVFFSCPTSFTKAGFLDGAGILAEPRVHYVCGFVLLASLPCRPPSVCLLGAGTRGDQYILLATYVGAGI